MEIEKVKITDIIPAEYNPRTISENELQKLTNSINEFGLVDPIIINLKNMHIIGGHQRYEALISQHMLDGNFYPELNMIKLGDVGWIFLEEDLTIESEDHEKALNLALNKISGEWDYEKLNVVLDELELSPINIELTGFDEMELVQKDLLDSVEWFNSDEEEDLEDVYTPPESEESELIVCPECGHEFER